MRRTRLAYVVLAVLVAVVTGASAASAADLTGGGTTTVTPERTNAFGGTFDRGAGSREFTDRLGAPPGGGSGALVLRTPSDEDKVQFVTREVAGPLSGFADTSYWTRRRAERGTPERSEGGRSHRDPASSADPALLPSFQIAVDIDGGDLVPGDLHLLTFVPARGTGGDWTRQDAGSGRWCVSPQVGAADVYRAGCAAADRRTLAEIADQYPGVSALAAGVNQGGGDGGLVAAVDLIHVGSRTYDFEP